MNNLVEHELEGLVAAWQVGAIDRSGFERMEKLLLEDEQARFYFARCCRQDVALRQLCEMHDKGIPGVTETGHLCQQRSKPSSGIVAMRGPSSSGGRRAPRRSSRRRTSSTSVLALMAAGCAVAAAVVVAILLGQQAPEPQPMPAPVATIPTAVEAAVPQLVAHVEAHGGILIQRDGTTLKASAGAAVYAGDRLQVRAPGALVAVDGSRFELAIDTEVAMRVAGADFIIQQLRGSILADVEKQVASRRVAIHTPHARVTVVGTIFRVTADAERTVVTTDEGLVRVDAHADASVEVAPGETVIVEAGVNLAKQQPKPVAHSAGVGVVRFDLLDAVQNRDVPGYADLDADAVVDLGALNLKQISIRADVAGPVRKIRFWLDGEWTRTHEGVPEFTLFGDNQVNYNGWNPRRGTYLIEAQAYSDKEMTQLLGPRKQMRLTIRR